MIHRFLSTRAFFLCLLWGWSAIPLAAQEQEKLYWTFPADSVQTIQLDIVDPHTVKPWSGNNVMVTAEVNLYNATKGILDHLVEQGRYGLLDTLQGHDLLLRSEQPQRSPIKRGGRECHEVIRMEIFVPKAFVAADEGRWVREEKESPAEDH